MMKNEMNLVKVVMNMMMKKILLKQCYVKHNKRHCTPLGFSVTIFRGFFAFQEPHDHPHDHPLNVRCFYRRSFLRKITPEFNLKTLN